MTCRYATAGPLGHRYGYIAPKPRLRSAWITATKDVGIMIPPRVSVTANTAHA